jgi:Fe-S-cluster containining protein
VKTTDPIAPLRDDLQMQPRPNRTVDVRDPFLLQVFTIEKHELDLAGHFDGKLSAKQIAKSLGSAETHAKAKDILRIARDLEYIDLLDVPEVWDKSPVTGNATPYTTIENSSKKLKVLPEPEPQARWSCGSCGACCHGLAVEVNAEEESRIDASLYKDILGTQSFIEEAFIDPTRPAVRILRQRPEDNAACIFLQDNGLCAVHGRQGMAAKPDACQIFPNMVIHTPDKKVRLAMRTNCRTMDESFETGQPVQEHREHILRILQTSGTYQLPKKMHVFGEYLSYAETETIRARINGVLDDMGISHESIRALDRELFEGRVKAARRGYGKRMLAYVQAEADSEFEVVQGGIGSYFKPLKRGLEALAAMKRGKKVPNVSDEVQSFLRAQVRHVLYAAGPMTFPDVGLGYVALFLALEATLHAVGEDGSLRTANDAFIAYSMPIIENTAHAWPILDVLDADFAQRLREDL